MQTLFDQTQRAAILARFGRLEPGTARQWGKMDPAQMMAHCSSALEMATGDRPRAQKLIGKILAPFFRKALLGEKPFSRNSPTDPTFVVVDARDFGPERQRLVSLIERFGDRGPAQAANQVHSFLGRLSGEEWGVMMHKHLDHHLRQFGA